MGQDSVEHATFPVEGQVANVAPGPIRPRSVLGASHMQTTVVVFVRTSDADLFTAPSVSKAATAPTGLFSVGSLVSCISDLVPMDP